MSAFYKNHSESNVGCTMFLATLILFVSLWYSLGNSLQINLHLTDSICSTDRHSALQHHCLHVPAHTQSETVPHEIITFCLTECPLKLIVQNDHHDPQSFTFAQLEQQYITTHQLYLWSASIDLLERYQLYLDQPTIQRTLSMANEVFRNCTWPRFGPLCQYSFDHLTTDQPPSSQQSLSEFVQQYYFDHQYDPTTLTCYTHLQCDRGPAPSCLDWSEICDGKVDCLDGGRDEEECWRVELNECAENEYRCRNGQCIPQSFFRDESSAPDCLDGTDEIRINTDEIINCLTTEPACVCEDLTCTFHQPYNTIFLLTSSCVKPRNILLWRAKISIQPTSVSDDCWFAFKCVIFLLHMSDPECRHFCADKSCTTITQQACPISILVPTTPILLGHVQFVYQIDTSGLSPFWVYRPLYICYNERFCDDLPTNRTLVSVNNVACRRPEDFPVSFNGMQHISLLPAYLPPTYAELSTCQSLSGIHSILCNRPNTYRCLNSSKCISIHHLHDGFKDCYHNDDEQLTTFNPTLAAQRLNKHFRCTTTDQLIPQYLVGDGICHCLRDEDGLCDDEYSEVHYARNHISFQTICDGATELNPRIIDNQNMTDETDCNQWMCNNTYTRCDGFWNCFNGADEVDCDPTPWMSCPQHHHLCWSLKMNRTVCLPVSRADDGIVDCLGATDEPRICRTHGQEGYIDRFYCENLSEDLPCIEAFGLCNRHPDCRYGEDELFCQDRGDNSYISVCHTLGISDWSHAEKMFCKRFTYRTKQRIIYFSLGQEPHIPQDEQEQLLDAPLLPKRDKPPSYSSPCHRGLALHVWSDHHDNLSSSNSTCLCPPAFYGPHCQYQNQRVTLTLQFRALSDSWQTLFAIVVLLIKDTDHQRTIESAQQLTYLPMRDCQTKFNLYLLYSTRPKQSDDNTTYSIHIDIYEKITLNHRSSWFIPLRYPFLPVHRLALQLDIPRVTDTDDRRDHHKDCPIHHRCDHGRCLKYAHSHSSTGVSGDDEEERSAFFCRCDRGWTGRSCSISMDCRCSLDSLCVGVDGGNRSICVCPMTRLGDRCLIRNEICDNDRCEHGGQCLPMDEYLIGGGRRRRDWTCICRRGYTGDRCEKREVEMMISFHSDLLLPQSVLVHFIRVHHNHPHENATTFKSIPVNQDFITLFWSQPFHLVFLELFHHNYYLAFVHATTSSLNSSTTTFDRMNKTLTTSDRCPHISELFNETIVQSHLLRRIKYYHLPCRQHRAGGSASGSGDQSSSSLKCFVDEIHLCVCQQFGEERLANCFEFDHEKKFDCLGQNGCENGAQCFQDNPTCPQTSMCICPTCFYGRRCQFSMNGFGLSLDAILAYHIRPHLSISHQSRLVQVGVIVTVLITLIGLINGFLSLITFKNKKPREVGCGYYLLGSSITTLLTMIIFTLKLWLLLTIQMGSITHRSFIHVQCLSMDFFLRMCLSMDQWLNACVAVERAVTALKGTGFNRIKSRETAKYVLLLLVVLMIGTTIHDPIYRRLIDETSNDEDEERTWCIASYPSWLRTFDSSINIVHLVAPFLINLISAVIITWRKARHRTTLQNQRRFIDILFEQVRCHSHLLMAPFLIVVLALPRLLIGIFADCMQSTNQSWLYLSGYFIAFFVPMLPFVLYVLPSKVYKNEFYKAVRHRRIRWNARIHPVA